MIRWKNVAKLFDKTPIGLFNGLLMMQSNTNLANNLLQLTGCARE